MTQRNQEWGGKVVDKNPASEQFVEIYKKYYSDMYYFAKKVLGGEDIAEDVVQEAFLVAFRKLDDLSASPSPKGWLFKVLRHIIGDTYRKQARLLETLSLSEDCDIPAHDKINLRLELEGAVGKEDLDILIKLYVERYTYQEIAKIHNISVAAAKKRVQRAKAKLRKELEKSF